MLKSILNRPEFDSSKATAWMMLSALTGQFINFLALPVLIGLFGAAAFGQYSLVISYVGIAVVLVTMQLEQAVPTYKLKRQARDLIRAILLLGLGISLAAGICVFVLLVSGYELSGFSGNSLFAAAVFAAIIFSEIAFVLARSWLVRSAAFKTIAWVQFIRPILFVLLTVGFGFLWLDAKQESGSLYLVFSTFCSGAIAVIFMFLAISKNKNENLLIFHGSLTPHAVFKQYSGVSTIAAAHILHHIGIQLPLWVVALNFNHAEVAWVAIAMRVTLFPVALSNNSVASVLNNRISRRIAQEQTVANIVRLTIIFSALVGFIGFGVLYILVELGLLSSLGSEWAEAGTTIQIFCLFAFAQFVFSVVRFVPIASQRHRSFLNWNVLRFLVLVGGAVYCSSAQIDYETTIFLFATLEILVTIAFLLPLLNMKDASQKPH